MKRKFLVLCLAAFVGLMFLPRPSSAFLFNWYIDPDGPLGPDGKIKIDEWLNTVGLSWTLNNLNQGTFQEWGTFKAVSHGGGGGLGTSELTGIANLMGNLILGGNVTFTGGSLSIYSDSTNDYGASEPGAFGSIYGADNGTQIAQWSLLSGSGTVDPSGVPNGQFTTIWTATNLTPGYWFMPDGVTDIATLPSPPIFTLGYSTTNASWVQNPPLNNAEELYVDYAGSPLSPGSWTNIPPADLFISGNGQWRIDVVPEPATMLLVGSGLIGLAGLGRRKFFKKA